MSKGKGERRKRKREQRGQIGCAEGSGEDLVCLLTVGSRSVMEDEKTKKIEKLWMYE